MPGIVVSNASMRKPLVVVCLAGLLWLCGSRLAVAQTAPAAPAASGTVRVFLDCNSCDETFLRTEITFIDYVRDRTDADLHVLVTTQDTGGGGTEYTLKFIGLRRFAGVEQTLTHVAIQTATSDERRRGVAEALKRGLVRYVSETPLGAKLKITFEGAGSGKGQADQKSDPWNLWVFRTNFGGNFSGERSNKGRSLRGSASANRTTDAWKVNFSASTRYNEDTFELSETETFKSVSRNSDFSALVVKSLSSHWSAGLVSEASSSTFLNYARRIRVAPGLEYNIFPYAQSTRRMFTLQYTVGVDSHKYKEETIFDKRSERLIDHRLGTTLSLRQPWGTASASVDFSQYLTAPDKYSISGFGAANIRLFKGFSFNAFTNLSRTKDQIYLPRGAASTEEILVRQRQLATGYQFYVNFGLSYSFGSIFNNVVNPRFGGGGGNFFFFD